MSTTDPAAADRTRTSRFMRVVFGLGATGLTIQWFDRLGRVLSDGSSGWALVWDLASLGLLPLAIGYFAFRALTPDARDAEPSATAERGRT